MLSTINYEDKETILLGDLRPVSTQENIPQTDNFSLSCELPCTTNEFKTKEIFLSEDNFPEWKRALDVDYLR